MPRQHIRTKSTITTTYFLGFFLALSNTHPFLCDSFPLGSIPFRNDSIMLQSGRNFFRKFLHTHGISANQRAIFLNLRMSTRSDDQSSSSNQYERAPSEGAEKKRQNERAGPSSQFVNSMLQSAMTRASKTIETRDSVNISNESTILSDGNAAAAEVNDICSSKIAEDDDSQNLDLNDLLQVSIARAIDVLGGESGDIQDKPDTYNEDIGSAVYSVLNAASARAKNTLSSNRSFTTTSFEKDSEVVDVNGGVAPPPSKSSSQDKRKYLDQPAVTNTALAHSMWASAIDPQHDTVIDATCGNGKDSLALAKILFSSETGSSPPNDDDDDDNDDEQLLDSPRPQLFCIDVQPRAVSNTVERLRSELPEHVFSSRRVRVMRTSHAPLPLPTDVRSVGLVCYNLGWLPGSPKDVTTHVGTTVASLSDAAVLLRVGGLLSVTTYPATNRVEARAISWFGNGLALFSSKKKGAWETYLDDALDELELDDDDADRDAFADARDATRNALRRVWTDLRGRRQAWRAFEHVPLGRPNSPVLLTVTRIK